MQLQSNESGYPAMANDSAKHLKSELEKRILILDGAMGTMLQSFGFSEEDFRRGRFETHPKDLKGNNDVLNLTQPDAVYSVHERYLEAGADIIETNTFNSNSVSQADYLLEDRVYELNYAGAQIARRAADAFIAKNPAQRRFVAGSIGPTGRTLSMSPDVNNPAFRNVTFDELAETYRISTEALIDGGADILLVETIFDTLNAKAAAYGIMEASKNHKTDIPVMFSATVSDIGGRLLAGQNVEAFLISILHVKNILSVGFNCALGAKEMRPHLVELSAKTPTLVSAHPNAGLPDELGRYLQTPEVMGNLIREFAEAGLLNIVGGCCGTNPEHIRSIAEAVRGIPPRRKPEAKHYFNAAGLDPLVQNKDLPFINIGERTNVAGSRKFLNLIKADSYREAVQIARDQVENGAQIIDVNMDDAMLDSAGCMKKFLLSIASEPDIARVPVMIDSSKWEVILEGLKCVQGKCIINSISLKEGEEAFLEKAEEARRFGAALLCMAFDEKGQADTVERRVEVCRRMYRLLTEKLSVPPEDIIFDPNVFAVATGMKEHDNYAADFIEAVRRIKQEMPLCHISGGISNVSFSFRGNELVRSALHAVFLYLAIAAGLDMAIVNPGQLLIYEEIEPQLRSTAESVILNRSSDAPEKLLNIAAGIKESGADKPVPGKIPDWRKESLEKRIEHALVKGDDSCIPEDMEEAASAYPDPVKIIEGPLMDGLRQVGILFGEGKMFLPQVVKTARVMKNAVSCLTPYIEAKKGREKSSGAGTIVLATVKGDVHDIGKNIVAVVLQCNNFRVVDLGVMTPMQAILDAAVKENADMIGLSGLITPSLEEMSSIAAEMERLKMKIPLLIGGAAASMTHTAIKLQPNYSAPVVYVKDASQSVPVANDLMNPEKRESFVRNLYSEYDEIRKNAAEKTLELLPLAEARARAGKIDFTENPGPVPKNQGVFTFKDVPLSTLTPYINWRELYRAWELKGTDKDARIAEEALLNDAKKMLETLAENNIIKPSGIAGIFPAASVGDNIEIHHDGGTISLPMLRQQLNKTSGIPDYSLADFIAPKSGGLKDYLGVFALTAGIGVDQLAESFRRNGDDYSAILLKSIADRLAEAFSEYLHREIRREIWGSDPDEMLSVEQLFAMKYKGIRPAPGYPCCPDHSMKKEIFELLNVEKELGICLTKSYMMNPAASVCGFYFMYPQSSYFNVGKIGADQLADYAKRRGCSEEELRSVLSYQ